MKVFLPTGDGSAPAPPGPGPGRGDVLDALHLEHVLHGLLVLLALRLLPDLGQHAQVGLPHVHVLRQVPPLGPDRPGVVQRDAGYGEGVDQLVTPPHRLADRRQSVRELRPGRPVAPVDRD